MDRDTRRIRCGDGFRSRAEVYLHADPTEKLEALSAVMPLGLKPGRFRAPDKLMAMLSTPGRKPKYAE